MTAATTPPANPNPTSATAAPRLFVAENAFENVNSAPSPAALLGFGFAGGMVAAVMTVTAARIKRWSRRASEEGAALLPQ